MAESVHDLYLRLGLHYSDLQSGFVQAENTLRTNMTRLNRENTIIRLRTEADLSGLDALNDATEIFTIRQNALNQQIENQMDRVRLASAEYINMARAHGENSEQARRATLSLERERAALGRLQRQLRELNDSINETAHENRSFLENLQERINNISPTAGRLAGLAAAFFAVGKAITTVADASIQMIEKFRELQKQSYDLNMSFSESKNFLRQMRLGGGDYGDFEGYIRGITDAFVKGEYDDPEAVALNKFGAKITDATGRLKNFKDLTEEVYQAWKKADAAGEGIEFLQLTGGEAGIRDAIQYFKRYEEAKEDASKIFDSGINPEELHRAERALNLLTEQAGEFKDALINMITPAATLAMEELFSLFRSGTEIVVESTEKVRRWGIIFEETFSNFGKLFSGETNFDEIFDNAEKKLKIFNVLQKETEKNNLGDPLNQYGIKRINQLKDDLQDLRIEIDFDGDEYQKALEQAKIWRDRSLRDQWFLSDSEKNAIQDLYSAKVEQIEQQQDAELEKIQEDSAKRTAEMLKNAADIEFAQTHSAFEKQLRDIELWKDAQLEKADTAEEVSATIANAAMKEADAFEKEMDRIKGKTESAQDRLARLTLSQYENDVRNAQKQYQEDLQEVPKELADAIYKAQIRQIKKRAGEDKNYTKRPEGGGSQFLDFSQKLGQSTKSLVKMDSAYLAQKQVIEKYGQSVKKSADKIGEINFDNSLQNKFETLGNQAIKTAENLNQIQKAVEWQNSKSTEKIDYLDENGNILTGDDPAYSQNYEQNGIKIIYGDESGIFDDEDFNNSVESFDFPNLTQPLKELTQAAGQIAQNLSEKFSVKSPPAVTINLTPNINLGGAYVFDDAMKTQLTDDIAAEIANAVKSAVETSSSQINFSYGN